jgi:O-antigen/teichoic acid export membrane protein
MSGALMAYGALLAYGLQITGEPEKRLAVLVIGAGVLAQPFDMASTWFQARQRLAPVVLAHLGGVISCAALRIGFVLTDQPLIWFVWPATAEIAIGSALVMVAYGRTAGSPLHWRVSGVRLRALLAAAPPLALASATSELYLRLPQVLIVHLHGTAAAGQYAVALRLSEALYFLPVIVCTALFPVMVRSVARGGGHYAQRMEALYAVMLWGGLAIATPLSLLAPWLIGLLFGPDYAAASEVLRIHAWSLPVVGLSLARGRALIAEGLVRFNLLVHVVNLILTLVLAWLLIPPLGAVGAAWAAVVPRLVSAVALNFAFARTREQGFLMCRAVLAPVRVLGGLRRRRGL